MSPDREDIQKFSDLLLLEVTKEDLSDITDLHFWNKITSRQFNEKFEVEAHMNTLLGSLAFSLHLIGTDYRYHLMSCYWNERLTSKDYWVNQESKEAFEKFIVPFRKSIQRVVELMSG